MSADATDVPRSPTDLPGRSWWAAVRRSLGEFRRDNVTDWAAALTYYSVLSIFPAMLVVVSLVGLAGKSVSRSLITNVGELAPGQVRQILVDAITELQRGHGGAGIVAVISLAAAIWSASGYVAAFMRAANAIYDIDEGRPIYKTLPIRVAITLTTLMLLSACAVAVVVSGPIAQRAGAMVGAGPAAITIFGIVKWPVLLLVVGLLFALLYWAGPNAKQGVRWVTPGGVFAVVIWLVASAGFAFYVAHFSSYNKTYGSLAGLIIFLVWIWVSNIAILLGAELNAELERGRAIAAGRPKTEEPYVELRDTRALDDPPPEQGQAP
ncbi:YihY/virulence factor BrkB family protein [Actinoallomurus sp. NBC_01490]|jgi:membrane protein|uniref:YihY/virulence factor BrkB family protein n=1 Tax=Actinoallomurus sp. NBC_01490 TaxID=2903557 RepID=UPI002E338647|nr:YihY/virulence factor BrkB family protein [Actinoallomurus sp. NBC_01490]